MEALAATEEKAAIVETPEMKRTALAAILEGELDNPSMDENTFAQMFERSVLTIKEDEMVHGKVVSVTKDEILELYLNEAYYGNLAYGIEAAAETYFNTTADQLTFSQAAFPAGLPQSPAFMTSTRIARTRSTACGRYWY